MKDVKQCSISSVAFTLEIDAYQTLYDYIEAIRNRYGTDPDGDEILMDIETRVAELILAVHSADRVVAKPLIDNIIAQLGSVDDICGDAQSAEQEPTREKRKSYRQLYRNIDEMAIGGVCSGIAAYVGCSVPLVRLIALLLLMCGGASFWIYVILWVVVPAAVTARQKLEMRGEPVTVSTIRDYYNSLSDSQPAKSFFASLLSLFGKIAKFFIVLVVVTLLIALVVSIIAIIVSLFAVIVSGSTFAIYALPVVVLCSLILFFAICIYILVTLLNSRRIKAWPIVVALFLWCALSIGGAMMIHNDDDLRLNLNSFRLHITNTNDCCD